MFLRNIWYYAMPGKTLAPGTMQRKILLGEPIVFARGKDGKAFALRDICPHRGVPLSGGRMYNAGEVLDGGALQETQLECPYHGWRFNGAGRCSAIPALADSSGVDLEKIRTRAYPTVERQGIIWIYMPQAAAGPLVEDIEPAIPAPELPGIGDKQPGMFLTMPLASDIDQSVIGLIDPAHGPYVHQNWFWRSRKSMHTKSKRFGPTERGFSMLKHAPSKNSLFYKILGSNLTTEITFELPGLRTEIIQTDKHTVLGFTAVTPIDEHNSEITQSFYWTAPWLKAFMPVFKPIARKFLSQDRDIVTLQNEGLKYGPQLMLVGDPDLLARWYMRLKKAWTQSVETSEPFEHPLKDEITLHWRT